MARMVMNAEEIRRALTRISHEIVEKQAGTEGLVLVGIQRRGVPLAGDGRLRDALKLPYQLTGAQLRGAKNVHVLWD